MKFAKLFTLLVVALAISMTYAQDEPNPDSLTTPSSEEPPSEGRPNGPRRRCFSFPRTFQRNYPRRTEPGAEPGEYPNFGRGGGGGFEDGERFDARRLFNRYYGNRRRGPSNGDSPTRDEIEFV